MGGGLFEQKSTATDCGRSHADSRRKGDYQAALACADVKRVNDYDGRGYLSQRYLGEFCEFFLSTAVDQVEFMQELLALDGMLSRIAGYAERRESAREQEARARVNDVAFEDATTRAIFCLWGVTRTAP